MPANHKMLKSSNNSEENKRMSNMLKFPMIPIKEYQNYFLPKTGTKETEGGDKRSLLHKLIIIFLNK